MINFERCKKVFEKYIDGFKRNDVDINLKYLHTFRVVNFCEEIANSLNLSNADIELAKLIGLLHDIGRFEQLTKYKTYSDSTSVNHAALGVRILKENDYINNYVENNNDKEIILAAIMNHNKFMIDKDLDERTTMFCKIIRDADKLDIIEMYFLGFFKVIPHAGWISPGVLESVLKRETVKNTDVTSKIDDYISHVALIFDLNYNYSIDYVNNKGLINNLLDNVVKCNEQEQEKLLIIKKVVEQFLVQKRGKEDVR